MQTNMKWAKIVIMINKKIRVKVSEGIRITQQLLINSVIKDKKVPNILPWFIELLPREHS